MYTIMKYLIVAFSIVLGMFSSCHGNVACITNNCSNSTNYEIPVNHSTLHSARNQLNKNHFAQERQSSASCLSTFTNSYKPICTSLRTIGTIDLGNYYGSAYISVSQASGYLHLRIRCWSPSYINVVGAVVTTSSSVSNIPTSIFSRYQAVTEVYGNFYWESIPAVSSTTSCCSRPLYVHVTVTLCRTSSCKYSYQRRFTYYLRCGSTSC